MHSHEVALQIKELQAGMGHGQAHHKHGASKLKTGPSLRQSYLPCFAESASMGVQRVDREGAHGKSDETVYFPRVLSDEPHQGDGHKGQPRGNVIMLQVLQSVCFLKSLQVGALPP